MSADETLLRATPGERVAYFEGALLTAGDFTAEQDYHRGRLGRVLAYLHGAGTIAGLDVIVEPAPGEAVEIRVTPGAAIDRLGRIVELDRLSCLRVARWLDQQAEADLTAAIRAGEDIVVVDVFARFHACAGELQPAFSTGNQDTLDAAVPSRLRDRAALTPFLRAPPSEGEVDPLPRAELPPTGADAAALHAFKRTELWNRLQPRPGFEVDGRILTLGPEHVIGTHDGTELLLARIAVPVAIEADTGQVRLDADRDLAVNNEVRLYSYGNAELALLAAGLER
jgi:hypothetical protein